LINAGGVLNKWKWPAINGREMFKGSMFHSANWDDLVALKGALCSGKEGQNRWMTMDTGGKGMTCSIQSKEHQEPEHRCNP
jgi:hypothetical protein